MQLAQIQYSPLAGVRVAPHLAQLDHFADLLYKEAMPAGFIGECSRDEVTLRHVFDSILPVIAPETEGLLPLFQEQSLDIFDLGAGSGLPSLPLAILFPQHRFHLLDAQEKRCRFAERAAQELHLENVHVYHGVVQDFTKKYPEAPRADVVVFRAFRKILASLELSLHVLRPLPAITGEQQSPKVLYWRSQPVPFSEEGNRRVRDLGFTIEKFVKFASAEQVLPRGMYVFAHDRAAEKSYPRSWKKISADRLVETES